MSESVSDAVNDAVARTVGIVGLGGIALIHALQVPEAFEETVYLGILFIGAILASLGLAAVLTRTSDQRAWVAAGGLAAAIMIGYVLTAPAGCPMRPSTSATGQSRSVWPRWSPRASSSA